MGEPTYVPTGLSEVISNPENLNFTLVKFPFETKLSFEPIYRLFKQQLATSDKSFLYLQEDIVKTMESVPQLLLPIENEETLENFQPTLDLIMATISPIAEMETAITIVSAPYDIKPIFMTSRFQKLIDFNQFDDKDMKTMILGKTYNAYRMILDKYYNRSINVDKPMVITFIDKVSGLKKHFKISLNEHLCSIVTKGEVPELSEEMLDNLVNNFWDINYWFEVIPPEIFEFHGMVVINFTEVTEEEALSDLRLQLLDRSSVVTNEGFKKLEQSLKNLFGLETLKLGLMSFSNENPQDFEMGTKIWNSILHDLEKMNCKDFTGSPYEKIFETRKPLVIGDTDQIQGSERFKMLIKEQQIKSMIVAPLLSDDKVIGILELASSGVNDLNQFALLKVKRLISLFSLAVKRSLEELESQIETIIREEYTSIHPTVAWKFEKSANTILKSRLQGEKIESDPIVFENVFPLFGMSDIRNSSTERNMAIKNDLIEHLNLAKKVINQAMLHQELPILNQIKFRIEKKIKSIKKGLTSGDETAILEFVKREVEPVFDYLVKSNFFLADALHKYNNALNENYGTLYKKRKAFEESLTEINLTISKFLDEENEKAQRIYPHYFEKYKTDGVEYNIYIGQSIVPSKLFDELLLKNMRLWQLKTMSEVARISADLKETLPLALDTTHLILVQSNSLSIRFREDEKKFDVDGAYNVRYEIVKKRIDKAFIKDSRQRLTQPGKIAIVYAQSKERDEYLKYIEFLQSQGLLLDKVEELELEELQGASGLKALRVEVNVKANKSDNIDVKNISLAVSKMVG